MSTPDESKITPRQLTECVRWAKVLYARGLVPIPTKFADDTSHGARRVSGVVQFLFDARLDHLVERAQTRIDKHGPQTVYWVPDWAALLWMAFPQVDRKWLDYVELEFARSVAGDAELQGALRSAHRFGGNTAVVEMMLRT